VSEEADSQAKKDSFAALRYKDFRSYLGMRFFFTFAYQMQAIVISAYVYKLTRNVLVLGSLGLCEAIPAIGIALYGGYVADKSEKRKMLLVISMLVLFASLVMFTVTMKGVAPYMHKGLIVPIIYFMIFLNGLARAFYGPATLQYMLIVYRKKFIRTAVPGAAPAGKSQQSLALQPAGWFMAFMA
jgi:hypothetical protein